MSLRVLSVAYPLAPLGEDAAGGAEQVLSLVEQGLVERGHRSLVVACAGSRTAGRLVPTEHFEGAFDEHVRREAWAGMSRAVEDVIRCEEVDLVHMHGVDFHRYLPPLPVPTLATLHLPPSFYPADVFEPERPGTFLSCVSWTQRRSCSGSAIVGVVPNGVAVERFLQATGPEPRRALAAESSYVFALGRICPEKGFHIALDAARRAGVECRLAGQVFRYEAHERYFRDEIAPRLDERRRFLGPVGFSAKRRLLREARCLLVPSLVDETSSLVAMEALAAGTPVVAFARGALPEIVEHGRTGFLVSDLSEMADAIGAVSHVDRETCRRVACERFSSRTMVDRYLSLYETILRRSRGEAVVAPGRSPVASC